MGSELIANTVCKVLQNGIVEKWFGKKDNGKQSKASKGDGHTGADLHSYPGWNPMTNHIMTFLPKQKAVKVCCPGIKEKIGRFKASISFGCLKECLKKNNLNYIDLMVFFWGGLREEKMHLIAEISIEFWEAHSFSLNSLTSPRTEHEQPSGRGQMCCEKEGN